MYDNFGHTGGGGDGDGGDPFAGFRGPGGGFVHPEDIFAQMFSQMDGMGMGGMGPRPMGPRKGKDIYGSMSISFMQAVNGCSKNIGINAKCVCDSCKGSGSADGKEQTTCSACKGTGQQQMQKGIFSIISTCMKCGGAGTVIKNPCKTCGGVGNMTKPKTVNIDVPPGVDSGINLCFTGMGDAGERGGPSGNLYIRINVESDPFFRREGSDIHCTLPISFVEAALGATVSVPTIKGETTVTIPSGSQPDDKIILRGKGVRKSASAFASSGNQVITLKVAVPKKLSDKSKELFEQLAKQLEEDAGSPESMSGTSSSTWKNLFNSTVNRVKKAIEETRTSKK